MSSDKDQSHKSEDPQQEKGHSTLVIFGVVSFYMSISLALVFLNKNLMGPYDFPFPLFVSWFQLIVAEVCIIVFGFLGERTKLFPLSLFAPWEWDWGIAKSVSALSVTFVCMISFNNICLQYVEVSMYQVARSLTILWTIILGKYFFPDQVTPNKIKLAVAVVVMGFTIGSIGEANLEIKGLVAGIIACFFVAAYNIQIKSVLTAVDNDQWRLLIYNTTISIVIFIPVVILDGSLPTIFFDSTYEAPEGIWTPLIISGILGILINIAIFMQINYTSPLTGAISGTVKV
eukprot:TRINITY_DN5179_c0_g1_i2.p1 TRINITY_DN5179_c0_g1~~TRINITY_DN5179_c0_g1_i2.p1  ORF type:complete len:288 (-),score=46.58 TRINITY_DN5179_c0_g1_i2:49-912(-)